MTQAKTRIEFLDLAKGFCIILVVIYHTTRFYGADMPAANFFKAFRMPLYFFLSGVFFKTYEGFFSFVKRKVNKLLVPFVFWYIIGSVCISLLLYHAWGIVLERAKDFTFWGCLGEFYSREDFPNSPIWFLLCLFEINLIFYSVFLLASLIPKYQTWVISIVSLLLGLFGVILGTHHINLPMFWDSSLSALPFFVVGYVTFRYTSLLKPNKLDKYNWLIIFVLFVLVYLFAGDYSLKYNSYSSKGILSMYPCGVMGVFAVVLLAKNLTRIPVISWWGRYSIMILVSHRLVYQAWAPLVSSFHFGSRGCIVVNLILTFASYFILIPFMKRFMPHVTAQKDCIPIR